MLGASTGMLDLYLDEAQRKKLFEEKVSDTMERIKKRVTFLGSTSKRVLRRTRKPVFIIPLPKGELDITFHDY